MNLLVLIIILVVAGLILAPMIGLNVIFLILGVVIAWAIFMRNSEIKKNLNKVPEQTLHIVNVEKGGVFELRGVGDSKEHLTLTVLAKHLYQEGDFSWFELECDKGSEEKVWVEVENDDETQVSIVLKKMKMCDVGTTYLKLDKIDDAEAGSLNYDGTIFNYTDSGDAVFYRFCDDAKPENFYYWDFLNGNRSLSVEKWGNDYEVFLSQKMLPFQIRVLRNNEG